ncbi:MAG: hypothetical protein AB7U23_16305 [Dehalococcoidia bacterium]|nr:hypothetical protein [Dehalococcoidia bacterium]MCA9850851.1 hypothetical protein [Dehalococcoidia bacterium]MCA9856135.1 hypothetical protein [Dehalococcoidia bacterium]
MKLDMLFFLGVFYTAFGTLLTGAWAVTREPWNLYGLLMLLVGAVFIVTRPRPLRRFFLGRLEADAGATQRTQCWCGRLMDGGRVCAHGEDERGEGLTVETPH